MVSVSVGSPSFGASFRLLLASSWPSAGLLLAPSFPTKKLLQKIRFSEGLLNRRVFFMKILVFPLVSVFRGVPPAIWGLFLASS